MDSNATRETVKNQYGAVARRESASCCGAVPCAPTDAEGWSQELGYTAEELASLPEGANLGLGCGNPTALAALKEGETVLDLGSGAGIDAFIAAGRVGKTGRVIGVDMTPDMLGRARENAVKAGVADRVEFREGIIEALPVVSDSVDVILSNCVINLSPDKPAVFREAFRVLKPGGRLSVSDILLEAELPEAVRHDERMLAGCVGGAILADEYLGAMREAGFDAIEWKKVSAAPMVEATIGDDEALKARLEAAGGLDAVAGAVWSYTIEARKPVA